MQNPTAINSELLDEFSPEFLEYGKRIRQEVHNRGRATGPRTEHGKQVSSRNALQHGLASGELIVPGESREEFDSLLQDLLDQHQPANATEALLVRQMAQSLWLSQRAIRLQNTCFSDVENVDLKKLPLFLRYYTTHERAFHKALSALLRLQKERRTQSRQFVSQKPEFVSQPAGFVSQNDPRELYDAGFVSQKTAPACPRQASKGAAPPLTAPQAA